MSYFFQLFYREIIKVIYTISDLEVQMENPNLLLKNSAIKFEPSTQKKEIDKQTASILYYEY